MQKVHRQKATYVGFCIIDLSKLKLFQFHYGQFRRWYPRALLLFTGFLGIVFLLALLANKHSERAFAAALAVLLSLHAASLLSNTTPCDLSAYM